MSEKERKISIGGIKFSEELVQVSLLKAGESKSSFGDLLQLLSEKKINITFLCHSAGSLHSKSSFCVGCIDFATVQEILDFPSLASLDIEVIRSVGTITLFPHRNSLHLLGLILNVFGKFDFPVYSLSTSISAIAVNTAYSDLARIADKLQDVVFLPDNHAPFRKEFRLKEI
ncbi:MAG: hypothetical protein JRJ68_03970 [Deltaproteobacteria bacterium]|nr:hypothetical protein [Deltaproteobacteria bacterium]